MGVRLPLHSPAKKVPIAKRSNTDSMSEDIFITRRDLAKRWRLSLATIKRREKTVLPHFRIAGAVRFALSEIQAIEQAARFEVKAEGSEP